MTKEEALVNSASDSDDEEYDSELEALRREREDALPKEVINDIV